MTRRHLLLIVLLAITLPCIEAPEWLTMNDDPSNDFALVTSKPEAASFHLIQSDPPPQSQGARPSTRSLLPHSRFVSKVPFATGQELLIFFPLQKE